MDTIKGIKPRLLAVKKIEKIVSAMEVVAATRLPRKEKAALEFGPYAESIRELFLSLAQNARLSHWLMREKQVSNPVLGLIVITSDRGLCGSFNDNILEEVLKTASSRKLGLIIIGKRGRNFLRRKGFSFFKEFTDLDKQNLEKACEEISRCAVELFRTPQVVGIQLLYNKFRLHLLGQVTRVQVLPAVAEPKEGFPRDYLYEPDARSILDELIPEYISCQIKSGILQSLASEEMARMVAMKYASDNARQLVDDFMLEFHKLRQAQITRELIEVVSSIPE
jgi:F-type H+-transporting ATPase subunit gamma